MMVMPYHFAAHMPASRFTDAAFLENGYLCVDLFFVLSGFVTAYSQASVFDAGYRAQRHGIFLLSRLARIYPLYALIVIESACMSAWRSPGLDGYGLTRTMVLNLALVQSWGLAPSLEGAAWSISTDWAAYILFPPLLMAVLGRSRWAAVLSSATALAAITYLAVSPGPFALPGQGRAGPLDIYSSATALPLLRCIAEFALGITTFRIARHLATRRQRWTGEAALATTALLLVALSRRGWDVPVVILFAVLVVLLTQQVGLVATLLGGAVPYRLGLWSYSTYLIHDKFSRLATPLQGYLARHVPAASLCAIVLMSSLVVTVSAGSFICIERPARNLSMRGIRLLRARLARPAAPTIPDSSGSGVRAIG